MEREPSQQTGSSDRIRWGRRGGGWARSVGSYRRSIRRRGGRGGGAFTLIELLVTLAIVGVLLTLVLGAAAGTLKTTRGFKCQMSQRSVAFDFSIFADDALHGDRGRDDEEVGAGRFRLETFQDSQYGLSEFWRWPDQDEVRMPDARGNDPLRCPEVDGQILLRRNTPCTQGAIQPPQRISYTFNLRLHRPEIRDDRGRVRFVNSAVPLTARISDEKRVPLLWDVDGQAATDRGVVPVFSAPSMGSEGPLADDAYWFPALRHNGEMNVAFIDGSVSSSARPLEEPGWAEGWTYQPVPLR